MTDTVGHSPSEADNDPLPPNLVPLDVVSQRFIAAGLPRSMRSLQRYCNNGTLDCVKEATQTGDAFFVHEHSVTTAIAALKQLYDSKNSARHDTNGRDLSRNVGETIEPSNDDDIERKGPTLSDSDALKDTENEGSSKTVTSNYVVQLEARIGEKDEEIGVLREELIDRRGQIRDMKNIIDGQNQLLETIQSNVAPIFNALAASVQSEKLSLDRNQYDQSDDRVHGYQTESRGSDHKDPSEHQNQLGLDA